MLLAPIADSGDHIRRAFAGERTGQAQAAHVLPQRAIHLGVPALRRLAVIPDPVLVLIGFDEPRQLTVGFGTGSPYVAEPRGLFEGAALCEGTRRPWIADRQKFSHVR